MDNTVGITVENGMNNKLNKIEQDIKNLKKYNRKFSSESFREKSKKELYSVIKYLIELDNEYNLNIYMVL